MKHFSVEKLEIPGALLFSPQVFTDERGSFSRLLKHYTMFTSGINTNFVEVYESVSKKGVLRGLHFQRVIPQGKLVRAVSGEIFDVIVDLRYGSPTFGKWLGFYLSEDNKRSLYIPRGCAHGFLSITDSKVIYFVTDYYYPEGDGGVRWNDADIGVEWPLHKIGGVESLIISKKDAHLPAFKDIDFSSLFPYSAFPW